MTSVRVVLADHNNHVRWALRTAIREEPAMTVVGEASDARGLVLQVETLQPDLVLIEWELCGDSAKSTLSELRALDPQIRVVVLSRSSGLERTALASGADAFVSKIRGPEELLDVLRNLAGA
jgi:DNA-binding NarL/FixJ family response regulator